MEVEARKYVGAVGSFFFRENLNTPCAQDGLVA